MKRFLLLLFYLLSFVFEGRAEGDDVLRVCSPGGRIEVSFENGNSDLHYSVKYKGDEILTDSKMGFVFQNQPPLRAGLVLRSHLRNSVDEEWEQPWGERRWVREQYNELQIELGEPTDLNRVLQITFRVFNDGIGFRYAFPSQKNLDYFEILEELTEFNFPEEHQAWWIGAFQPRRYEYLYQRSPINAIEHAEGVHTPLTVETKDGLYLSIHEAELVDYASMCLKPTGDNGFRCALTPWHDGIKVKDHAPHQTPWRTIQIGERPGDLVESSLVLNLNPANVLGDVSWVEPMKYVGIWWGMHIGKWTFGPGESHGATTERAKEYIDFAADNGFQEVLVEGWNVGWKTGPDYYLDKGEDISFTESEADYDLKEVQAYARSKGVSVQIYHETMSNAENYLEQIDDAFRLLSDLGIRSTKIGQVGRKLDQKEWHYSQYGVNYYREVLKKAAEYKISVCFHEPIKDTGERRTYPNMLSREGARGMEYDAWSKDGGNPPEHTCVLPFTRLLSGPMDYTPGVFRIDIPERPHNQVNTTLAKQLALYVIIFSPIQMASDLVENYANQPALRFIQDVPVNWETTKVLDSKIGDFVFIARKDRASDDWYLGGITDELGRDFEIDLDFLEAGVSYLAEIYRDADDADYLANPMAHEIETRRVTSESVLPVRLVRGGGVAVRFKATDDIPVPAGLERN